MDYNADCMFLGSAIGEGWASMSLGRGRLFFAIAGCSLLLGSNACICSRAIPKSSIAAKEAEAFRLIDKEDLLTERRFDEIVNSVFGKSFLEGDKIHFGWVLGVAEEEDAQGQHPDLERILADDFSDTFSARENMAKISDLEEDLRSAGGAFQHQELLMSEHSTLIENLKIDPNYVESIKTGTKARAKAFIEDRIQRERKMTELFAMAKVPKTGLMKMLQKASLDARRIWFP